MPYNINGQQASISEPVLRNGATFVPLRDVVTALGGTVNWDNNKKEAAATIAQWTARFTAGADTADVNGTQVQFPVPSYIEDGELMVPAQFFHNAYGYKVDASGTNVTISL